MPASDQSTYLHLSRRSWIALGSLLALPWILLVWVLRNPAAAPAPAPVPARKTTATTTGANGFTRLAPGPWGALEYSRIVIEPPTEFIPVVAVQPDALKWVFRGYTDATLQQLWQRAALTPAQRESFENPERREAVAGAIVLHPEPNAVISLAPAARAAIYTVLAEFPENGPQNAPFRLRADIAQDWFNDSGLPPPIVTLARDLFYSRGNNVIFSDQDIILPQLESSELRVRFLKTLSRKSTMLVQLRVTPDTDTEALANYWGRGRRSKDVRPLLQSLVRVPGGATIDVVHLLPPFPRSLLYTYPLPSELASDGAHDCHWSAFNFFKDEPDQRFNDIDYVKQTLLGSYYPVVAEPTFGDIVVLVQPNGVVVHSCVYIAADLVFTKNGSSFSVPWVIGNLDQVVAFYALQSPLEVRRYRSKDH